MKVVKITCKPTGEIMMVGANGIEVPMNDENLNAEIFGCQENVAEEVKPEEVDQSCFGINDLGALWSGAIPFVVANEGMGNPILDLIHESIRQAEEQNPVHPWLKDMIPVSKEQAKEDLLDRLREMAGTLSPKKVVTAQQPDLTKVAGKIGDWLKQFGVAPMKLDDIIGGENAQAGYSAGDFYAELSRREGEFQVAQEQKNRHENSRKEQDRLIAVIEDKLHKALREWSGEGGNFEASFKIDVARDFPYLTEVVHSKDIRQNVDTVFFGKGYRDLKFVMDDGTLEVSYGK